LNGAAITAERPTIHAASVQNVMMVTGRSAGSAAGVLTGVDNGAGIVYTLSGCRPAWRPPEI